MRHIACAVMLASCTGDQPEPSTNSGYNLVDAPLSGTVAGDAWELKGAIGQHRPEGGYELMLHSEPIVCGGRSPSPGFLIWADLGAHDPLAGSVAVSLWTGSESVETTAGLLELSLDEAGFSGGLVFDYDEDHTVNGRFTAVDCDD